LIISRRIMTLKRPETAPSASEFTFTQSKLVLIGSGSCSHVAGNTEEPRFITVGFSVESSVAFMVGEVEVVGIAFGYSALPVTLVAIPADEIDSIIEIVPVGA
jgi:hypothetical protein